jgi:hypothetical protein
MSRFDTILRGCLHGLILSAGACAAPVLEVRNTPTAGGGELVISGRGFAEGGHVQLATSRTPGHGPRIFGVVLASEPGGAFRDFHYAYSFGTPYVGQGCPNRLEQTTRYLSVRAVDMRTQDTTSGNVIIPDCYW